MSVIDFCTYRKENEKKKDVVLNFLISYYKDLNETGTVNIPYFLRARDTYNEIIKNNKDLNFYYKKIMNRSKNIL